MSASSLGAKTVDMLEDNVLIESPDTVPKAHWNF
jgi:hypothetical protein